eukprot:COSAG01_NODE_11493_length_1922_cov_7.001097_1_plen_640_part_11
MRLWYSFCGRVLESEAAFEGKMEELCRELGDRGQNVAPRGAARVGLQELVRALRAGGEQAEDALAAVLEHGFEVLEALSLSTPRRQRKGIRAACDRLEETLEVVGELVQQLACAEETALTPLSEYLCLVDRLKVEDASLECVTTVIAVLDELLQHGDPVVAASRALESQESAVRARGMVALASLPRIVLEQVVDVEVGVAKAVCQLVNNGPEKKFGPAWLALFALCFRNGLQATISVMASDAVFVASHETVHALGAGILDGLQGALLVGAATAVGAGMLGWEAGPKCVGPARATMERQINAHFKQMNHATKGPFVPYTRERTQQLLPCLLEAIATEDIVVASAVSYVVGLSYTLNRDSDSTNQLLLPALLDGSLALCHRIVGLPQATTAGWWGARAEELSLETLCLTGPWMIFLQQAILFCGRGSDIPRALALQWKEIILRAVHMAKMTQAAELSQRSRRVCVHSVPVVTIRLLASISGISSQRDALVSPGLIEVLLYIVEHENLFANIDPAVYAAMMAANLIGQNEGGLTLTRQTVAKVLGVFMSYFDPTSRRGTYPVKKIIGETKTLIHMMISDKNKEYVVQHAGAIDSLVGGLLLDVSNPRRTEEGAAELQQMCALVLQNLALSPIGAAPLRAHGGA